MAQTYERKLQAYISLCANTTRVYILQGAPMHASIYAENAARAVFQLHPELRPSDEVETCN